MRRLPYVTPFGDGEFRVVAIDGESPIFPSRDEAAAWLEEHYAEVIDPSRRPRARDCLCCGAGFISAGFHNRLCGRCRSLGSA